MATKHTNVEPSLDAVLSRLGKRALLHYTIDLSKSLYGRGGFAILWSLNQRVETTEFATYRAARKEFYRRLKRLQKEGYRVTSACDAVMRQLHDDTIGSLKLRERCRVPRTVAATAEQRSVMQFVPAGRRVHVIRSPFHGEPYALDDAGTRVDFPKELGRWFVELSRADTALEIFEGVLTNGKIILIDVCYHNSTDYRQRPASERMDILRTLTDRSPSPWVEMAATTCVTDRRDELLQHSEALDGVVALTVPFEDPPASAADERWVEFSWRQQAHARVGRRLADDRIDVEMRLSTGRWARVGEVVCTQNSPVSTGDIVTVGYQGVTSMNAELIGAQVLGRANEHDRGACGIDQLL